ncbi:gamma-aminobutyric acid type B receptor subunit 2-like [Asterias rubens]|uniref:gamma-aminobutyric acid type B receptor subunit 2-like n=1 Tax=Asterias rubens TaxID=7604 RepID=UPI0014554A2A|nr:gamma-aminobutyric acid type B receptor subunit 2-like [Asterias rubens]
MYGPNYVWILTGYVSSSWQSSPEGVHCSSEELRIASEGYFKVGFIMYGLSQDVGRCGKTPEEFRQEISPLVGYNITVDDQSFGALGYDGMWALALAMHGAQDVLLNGLDSYPYGDIDYARTVTNQLRSLDFDGMSGPVRFANGRDRLGKQRLLQNIGGKDVPIGTYESIADKLVLSVPVDKLWYDNGGKPPPDSDITLTVSFLQATPIGILVGISILASLGLLLDFAFIGFNIIKRKHKQIKMSSPRVNNIIAMGFMLAYLCVVLIGIDRSMVGEGALLHVCRMRSWLFVIAFTLSFGGMFTKMWRIYSIVIANKTKRKVIKDRYLFGIIAVLLLVDFAILLPWQIIDPIHIEEIQVPIPQTAEDIANHEQHQLVYVNCTSNNNTIWILILLIYKAFVVVFGAFLAWSTRNINVPGLNDSYYVGLSIYNTVICCVVAVPLSFLAVSSIGVTFALVSGFLLFCITASVCMLFFPKIIAVYRKNDVTCSTVTGMIGTTATTVPASADKQYGLPSTSANHELKSVSENLN